jgi:hypothetical protein
MLRLTLPDRLTHIPPLKVMQNTEQNKQRTQVAELITNKIRKKNVQLGKQINDVFVDIYTKLTPYIKFRVAKFEKLFAQGSKIKSLAY